MPTYDYLCENCGHRFEHFQSMKEKALTLCPVCNQEALVRLVSGGSGLIFKGSGFYITDYKKSHSLASDSNGTNGKTKTEKPSPSEKKETKTD
ncbi:zinc ribbon domain-containing protein [candidate division KSB1 bacterium]|nr:zinc ribbon domain-containing protein [candidate division KSB1 bacterium]